MLGMSCAASILSVRPKIANRDDPPLQRLAVHAGILTATFVLVFVGLFACQELHNREILRVLTTVHSLSQFGQSSDHLGLWLSSVVGLVMAVPYFIFGWLLTTAIQYTKEEKFARLYGFDLLGAAVGCVLAYLAMEAGHFCQMVALPISFAVAGMLLFLRASNTTKNRMGVALIASIAAVVFVYSAAWRIDPKPELHSFARDYALTEDVEELWHRWSSYSRVGLLSRRANDKQTYTVVIGNSNGHARLAEYPLKSNKMERSTALMTALGHPQKALILMAGTGWEMQCLDQSTGGSCFIKGVELNPRVRDAALLKPELGLANFYAKPNISYVVDEGRSNLERDKNKYDVIFYSWSGATSAYYTGAMGPTVQYVYTKEALESALKHLTDRGYLIFLNTSKPRLIAIVKSILGPQDISNSIVLLDKARSSSTDLAEKKTALPDTVWDEDILLVKPSGFSSDDVSKLEKAASQIGLKLKHAPGLEATGSEGKLLNSLIKTSDLQNVINNSPPLGRRIAEDDKPFILLRSSMSADISKLFSGPGDKRTGQPSIAEQNGKTLINKRVLLAVSISALACLVILTPPLFFRRKHGALLPDLLAYFFCLGAGFMFVEVGLANQLNLLVGDPGLALCIVLAGLICASGAGSLFSAHKALSNKKALISAAFILVCYLLALYFFAGSLIHCMLAYELSLRAMVALAVVIPAGLLMGLFLPRGLEACAEQNPDMLPLVWAVNGAVGTSAAACSWALAELLGFKALVLIGTTFYFGILLLLCRMSVCKRSA